MSLNLFYSSPPPLAFTVEEEQQMAEEEDAKPDEEEAEDRAKDQESMKDEDKDEGIEEDSSLAAVDPIDDINVQHVSVVKTECADPVNPVIEDVLMGPRHLHLPGYDEVEKLALLLLNLADDSHKHKIPAELSLQIFNAAAALHEHDKTARSFVKKYESKWGFALFGRVLGKDSPEASAAQKTKFSWMKYAQAARITDESRLLYVIIKMLKNRPTVGSLSSPSKVSSMVWAQYKRITDRVRDDSVLTECRIPLPNVNVKSISTFIIKEEKRANLIATVVPKAPSHRRVVSTKPIPDAPTLPTSLSPPNRPQVRYETVPLKTGDRHGKKRKLEFDSPRTEHSLPTLLPRFPIKPVAVMPKAPILVVVPSQPHGGSISFRPSTSSAPFTVTSPPPPPPNPKPCIASKSKKPCAACGQFNCGGQRRRFKPPKEKTENSSQKMFTFCPHTRKSLTPGFTNRVFDSYEHFQEVVIAELAKK